jgi:hypothetical protein
VSQSLSLYIDTTSNSLITGNGNPAIVSAAALPFFYGDTVTMNIWLFSRIATATGQNTTFPFQVIPTTGLTLFFYIDDGTVNGTIYTQQISWTADLSTNFFTAPVNLATSGLLTIVEASQPAAATAYMKIGYIQSGQQTCVIGGAANQVNIGVGLPSSAVPAPPAGQTPLSLEVAKATFVQLLGPPGLDPVLTSPNGHKIQLACVDNPDGTHSFQTIDLG